MTQPAPFRRVSGPRPRLLDLFCTGGFTLTPPPRPAHAAPVAKMGRPVPPGYFGQFVGNFSGVDHARRVMGVPWMNRDGIRECIPPAYSEFIGRAFFTARATTGLGVAA
ncbi:MULTISPECIES: hypothetical protein [Streptomyces]|uniref:hypothetical protein n=1 Tax=Streptomyces TaxID=1883 RepID=UPI00073E016B|nr:hypothetical protein EASAB2608_01815 [Streptomyces sp. EAS-AB2608]CUW28065.1 hypothetical protein TUE45_02795 [Streptomyces reticuli]